MAVLGTTMLAAGLLAGCAPEPPDQTQSETPSNSAAAGKEPAEAPTPTEFDPDGTAEDNLALFAEIVNDVWASDDNVHGHVYIDALVDKGFDKSQMQVTSDITTIEWPAESIMFSVAVGEGCLVGQVGPETGDPVAIVQPVLGEGVCLLGNTREIDW